MDIEEVSARIVAATGEALAGTQRELLGELTRLYGSLGVLGDAMVPSLPRICPAAAECWKGIAPPKFLDRANADARSEKGCVFLPWVGPGYQRGGICVVGLNLRYSGDLWDLANEYRIALQPNGQLDSLKDGKNAHKSRWARHTMCDVVALQRSSRGEVSLDCRDNKALAGALLSSARVQAIKCSPMGGRSSPEWAMAARCPPRYLVRELEVLRPSVLLVYGAMARNGVEKMIKDFSREDHTKRLLRRSGDLFGAPCEVFFLTHPAHGGWHPAHKELIASLGRRAVDVGKHGLASILNS